MKKDLYLPPETEVLALSLNVGILGSPADTQNIGPDDLEDYYYEDLDTE